MKLVQLVGLLFLSGTLGEIDDFETLSVELLLTDLALEDFCEDFAVSSKKVYYNTSALQEEIKNQTRYAEFLRVQAGRFREFGEVSDEQLYNWTVLSKPGDTEMNASDYEQLVVFSSTVESIVLREGLPGLRNAMQNGSSKNNDTTDLPQAKASWEKRQEVVSAYAKEFPSIFNLTRKAASANREDDVVTYWETLSESSGMYAKLHDLWKEIEPLYNKLHKFVRKRLLKHYGMQHNRTEIPVYLLGSGFGEDWSNVAEFVIPHPQMYQDVITELQHMNIKTMYKLAENMTRTLGFKGLNKKFWTDSVFNSTNCNTVLFAHCKKQFTEIITCNSTSWTSYLRAHEEVMKTALNNEDYSSLQRRRLRFSAADEAISGLSSLLAVNNLPFYGILEAEALNNEEKTYNERMTALLLLALKVLPKLSYYVAVEMWRIDQLKNQNGLVNLAEEWWKKRKDIQGVEGVTNKESDYLMDLHIVKNQPYISNILGIFLQFQLYDYHYKNLFDENYNVALGIGEDPNFMPFVRNRATRDWPSLVLYYYGISEISTAPLLQYFEPLEKYMEEAPEEQMAYIKKPPKKVYELLDEEPESVTTEKSQKNKSTVKTKSPVVETKTTQNVTQVEDDLNNEKTTENDIRKMEDIQDGIQNDQDIKERSKNDDSSLNKETTEVKSGENKNSVDVGQTVGTYIGIAVILFSVVTIAVVLIRRKFKKKRRPNNRRFET